MTIPQADEIDRLLQQATGLFQSAIGDRALLAALTGSNLLISAAYRRLEVQNLPAAYEAVDAIKNAAPHIAEAARPTIAPERVYFALGAATGALTVDADHLAERLAYLRILASEINALILRRWLDQSGDQLVRTIRIRQALVSEREPISRIQ
ncbi:MAG: hypothetical protein WBA44_00030 [Mesorhizobium sp.]